MRVPHVRTERIAQERQEVVQNARQGTVAIVTGAERRFVPEEATQLRDPILVLLVLRVSVLRLLFLSR